MRNRRPRQQWVLLALLLLAAGAGVVAWRPQIVLDTEYARLRWLAGARVHQLSAADHRWVYLQAGEGPTVVLVHGFTGAKEHWLPMMRVLARSYRVIAPDLPGWNDSERKAGADYGVLSQAERLSAFLSALDTGPVALVGHSMGGHIAGLLAADHPELVRELVLMSSAGVPFKSNAFTAEVELGHNPMQVRNRAELHRQMALVFSEPPLLPWPADLALARQRAANAEFESAVLREISSPQQRYALAERLPEIAMPVLLLWCRQDQAIDVSAADVFARDLPNSRKIVFEGCGHMPMMERPNAVADALARFFGVPSAD